MRIKNTGLTLIACLALSACGSDSSGGSIESIFSDSSSSDSIQNNGCEQEYYQTIIGEYSGFIELLDDFGETPRVCSWQASVSVTGESILATCQLRASTTGTVTQSTFYPDDDLARYQCIDDRGQHTVRDPFNNNTTPFELPGLDNSLFPIDISFSGNSDVPFNGPVFDDETMIGRYFYLYDGINSDVVRQITVDGFNSLTFRTSNGVLLGSLIKD